MVAETLLFLSCTPDNYKVHSEMSRLFSWNSGYSSKLGMRSGLQLCEFQKKETEDVDSYICLPLQCGPS